MTVLRLILGDLLNHQLASLRDINTISVSMLISRRLDRMDETKIVAIRDDADRFLSSLPEA